MRTLDAYRNAIYDFLESVPERTTAHLNPEDFAVYSESALLSAVGTRRNLRVESNQGISRCLDCQIQLKKKVTSPPLYNLGGTALAEQVGGSHYVDKKIQPIEYCMANNLNACESAIVKYITRWADKGGVQDLHKIKHYVDLLIQLDPRAQKNSG